MGMGRDGDAAAGLVVVSAAVVVGLVGWTCPCLLRLLSVDRGSPARPAWPVRVIRVWGVGSIDRAGGEKGVMMQDGRSVGLRSGLFKPSVVAGYTRTPPAKARRGQHHASAAARPQKGERAALARGHVPGRRRRAKKRGGRGRASCSAQGMPPGIDRTGHTQGHGPPRPQKKTPGWTLSRAASPAHNRGRGGGSLFQPQVALDVRSAWEGAKPPLPVASTTNRWHRANSARPRGEDDDAAVRIESPKERPRTGAFFSIAH